MTPASLPPQDLPHPSSPGDERPTGAGSGGVEPRRPAGGEGVKPPRTVTKKELVTRIAERTSQTKVVVKDVIQMFLDDIIDELARGNRLEFREFGVFEVKARSARRAQNPRTLVKVDVPAKRVVKFKVGRTMRNRVENAKRPGPA
ncbi:MAG: integration host factor subunit beta [Planctomycetes bacterium]|nr:integration host factor subunit beta [Planctomycetota bacterium]MCB9825736.1 integration host factor subunit beta [Planctomycetota bacterium]MCB9830014.1 integration host factor subunit beta [Planctomycetota bacterium]